MQFQLVTVSPGNYTHSQAFAEFEKSLFDAFISLKLNVRRSNNLINFNSRNLIIGWHLLNQTQEMHLPAHSIIYNLEQMDDRNEVLINRLVKLSEKHVIWDYNIRNIEILRKSGARGVIKFAPIGIMPSLRQIPSRLHQDIDVLFYGSINARRKFILDRLKSSGVNLFVAFGVYGQERDDLISRAKVILNLHFYETSILEMVRLSYLFINSKAVVSECHDRSDIPSCLGDAALFVSYDKLVDSCKRLLLMESERSFFENSSFLGMSKMLQSDILRPLIFE